MKNIMKSNALLLHLCLVAAPLSVGCGGDDVGVAPKGGGTSGGAAGQSGTGTTGSISGSAVSGSAVSGSAASGSAVSGSAVSGTGTPPAQDAGAVGTSGSASGTSTGTGGHVDAGTTPTTDAGTGHDSGLGADASTPVVDPSKKITVWMAGDSTMQPCTTACPCGWGSQFQPFFTANATVVNSAAGGRSIQTWLYDPNVTTTMLNGECVVNPMTFSTRWQAMLDPTNGMKAGDYLFIEFGINDTDATCNRHVGTALFQSYLESMAQAAKDRGAHPILLTSTSYMLCTGATVTPNRAFGPQTKAAGAAEGVPVIDLTLLSANLYTTLGLCPNDLDFTSTTSAVGKFFCDDHTHFESAGAVQIAAVVAQALRDQNIPLAAYLK